MKKYCPNNLNEVCNICGIDDGSPLKINRVIKDAGSFNEKFHYHKKGYEYYILVRGEIMMGVRNESITLIENEFIRIDPEEPHRIEKILQNAYYFIIKTNSDPKDKIILE